VGIYPIHRERVALDIIYGLRINICNQDVGQSVRHPIVHRPIPQYPAGYDYRVGYPPLTGGHTSDESPINATPSLTDLHSESFYCPATEDVFTRVSESLQHENILQPAPESQVSCFSTGERPLTNSILAQDTKSHLCPQISHRVLSTKINSPRGAPRRPKPKPRDTANPPAFTSRNIRRWSPTSFL